MAAIRAQTLFKHIEMRTREPKRKSKQKDDTSEFKVRETLDHCKLSDKSLWQISADGVYVCTILISLPAQVGIINIPVRYYKAK